MQKAIAWIGLWFALSGGLAAASPCAIFADLIGSNTHFETGYEGLPVATDDAPRMNIARGAEWRFLGEGWNGQVFRVIPSNGDPSFIIKTYKELPPLRNDQKAFSLIRSALEDKTDAPIGIVDSVQVGSSLRLTDLRGYTLSAYRAAGYGGAQRDIETRYLSAVRFLAHTMESKLAADKALGKVSDFIVHLQPITGHLNIEIKLTPDATFKDLGGNLIKIWINPDNVLITEQGELYIIDPY